MRSTFKRGPGSGFGLSNLKPPHTLGKEEGETIRGVQRFCSALCVLLWALHTPIWSTTPRYACHPGWGTLQCPPSAGGHPPLKIARGRLISLMGRPRNSGAALCASKAYGQGL